MLLRFVLLMLLACAFVTAGCSEKESAETAETEAPSDMTMDGAGPEGPPLIVVQHILVGFEGTVPGKDITRSREEAEALVGAIMERIEAGEDFDVLVAEYTDDSHPGIYSMANFDEEADMGEGVFPRARMVRGFGDVGFSLDVGEVGVADYDPDASKYGWHIIKRIE